MVGGTGFGSVDDGFESGIGLVECLGELQVADDRLVEALSWLTCFYGFLGSDSSHINTVLS